MPGSLILHKFVFGTCFWRWLGRTSEVASFSFCNVLNERTNKLKKSTENIHIHDSSADKVKSALQLLDVYKMENLGNLLVSI